MNIYTWMRERGFFTLAELAAQCGSTAAAESLVRLNDGHTIHKTDSGYIVDYREFALIDQVLRASLPK